MKRFLAVLAATAAAAAQRIRAGQTRINATLEHGLSHA